jgi:hypothetical protein
VNPLAVSAVRAAGSKHKFLEYARGSDHTGVQSLIEKFDQLSRSDRRALTLTDLCVACDLKFYTLLGEVASQAYKYNADVSSLLAAVWQPKVVAATIKSATTFLGPDGVKDRQMLHTHANFLPVPKSSSTIFRFQQQINNTHEAGDGEASALPTFSSDIIAFNAAQRGKLLPAAVAEAEED